VCFGSFFVRAVLTFDISGEMITSPSAEQFYPAMLTLF
jgi:hypothetical protein